MFSQTAEYSLRAMMVLAANEKAVGSEHIASETRVPKPYLSKILRDLVVAKLVISQRGPNGGFVLGRPAGQITVLDVLNAVDPLQRITECPLGRPDHQELCLLHRQLDEAIATVECTLRNATLADLDPQQISTRSTQATRRRVHR